ncbi:Telomerase reverse transcriptase [Vigna angularis]|uniref:Telomerase reverse transcriptase n=3 Tax=Phaseolus angularis TaxID=3914 RepID=A0A8T0JJW3_PHAAN|nr:telomerase reverse transcriptase isoform X1 [Vigna angularis]KAG2372480.1 Telomerase reverse transcriptase [Vigna angularis]
MARKSNKRSVPGVLWRMFRHRARTLSDTVTSLLPPPPELCRCDGRCCLGCTLDAKSFLLRPDDPSDYRKLLTQCYVVVSENTPALPFFVPLSGLSQDQVVKRTIEQMLHRREPVSNVLCSGYDRIKCSSRTVELLSSASWSLLLSRVGDDFMIYLLRNTSIFLPAPLGNHHQVGGPPISRLCFDMLKGSPKFDYQTYCEQKRKRTDVDDPPVEKRKCHISCIINGPLGFSSNLGMTDKSSMQLIRHHGSRNYDVSVSEVPKFIRTETVIRKSESEGNQGSNCITPRLGKRSRPFRWQRRRCKLLKQLTLEENSLNIQPNTSSLSYHAEMSLQCACCLILQSLPAVPKRTNIQRQSIFYSLEPSRSVLPKKNILYSLKPNLACSEHLIGNIFGFSDVNASAQSTFCLHSNDSCLINSECLYHCLVKCFKQVIRRTQCCQHTKLLNKHCVFPSLNKNTIRRSSSEVKVNKSGKFLQKTCVDNLDDGFKSYCSKSQVVSFVWAVSRTLLPSELLGTPLAWRTLRRNISKFIHLRRFETFSLKLCMHKLKISWFPFLSNKHFFQKEFKNRNDPMHVVKRKLLEKWIFWYFSCLVVPLLQANFYVTESAKGKHDIYYYAKPIWEKLVANTTVCFKDRRYSYLDDAVVHNILRGRQFGFSKLRLQPKEDGVRMVANLKGSSTMPLSLSTIGVQNWRTKGKVNHQKIMYKRYPSVNSVLRDAYTILKGILFEKPHKLGSSVFNYDDVYKKLCPFLVGQKIKRGTVPNLFMITSDVLQAFDSIDQNHLLGIVKNVLVEDGYFLKEYHQVICTKKSLWVQKQLMMLDESSNNGHTRFTSFASFQSWHCVFVNQERCKLVKKKVLFSDLTEHVKHNVLQFDGKFYLQDVGIPQGGVLSSLLCSMYYGHLEKRVIFPFLEKTIESGCCKENNDGQTNCPDKVSSSSYMLMRFLDDFLFISTSKRQADSFFSRLQRGFRGYNCYMNEKKFGANFDVEQISGSSLNRVYVGEDGATSFLRWSGLLINCSTMEIQADYTKYLGNHLSSTLTVRWQGKPGITLKEKLCLFLRPKCYPIFFDSNINSAAVVRLNVFQVFLLCAMKFHCYIRDLSFICKFHKRYCSNIIQGSLRYLHLLIKKRMHSMRLNSDVQPILELEKEEVEWLGFQAYIQVLKRKESRHKELLAILRSRLLSHRMSGRVSPELKYAIDTKNSSLLWEIKY